MRPFDTGAVHHAAIGHRGVGVARIDVAARHVVGMRVDAVTYGGLARTIAAWARAGESRYICVASVNNVILSRDDPLFLEAMNAADVTTPDGMPLVWALRLLGVRCAERVCGPALMDVVCERAAQAGLPIGLYGGTEDVLLELEHRLVTNHPGLDVAFAEAPPFRRASDDEIVATRRKIVASGARILFVGLGAPKQERWMADNASHLPCVMLGIGAAFDVLAGRSRRAPSWMQSSGLEWAFRLTHEPRRLWRRYLVGNPRFVRLFARQLIARMAETQTGLRSHGRGQDDEW